MYEEVDKIESTCQRIVGNNDKVALTKCGSLHSLQIHTTKPCISNWEIVLLNQKQGHHGKTLQELC